jgi:hypothetical protein
MSNLPQRRRVLMFTESEKNEIVARVVEYKVAGGISCPFHGRYTHKYDLRDCNKKCGKIFPELPVKRGIMFHCPCSVYYKKRDYVIDTFWKAMK